MHTPLPATHLGRWRPLRRLFLLLVGLLGLAAGTVPAIPAAQASGATAIVLNTTNWSGSAGFGATAPAWNVDGYGVVHLQGAAKQVSTTNSNATSCSGGGSVNLLGTLPAAARPSRNVFTTVHTYLGTYADLGIQTDGEICLIAPRSPAVKDFSFVSLEGISYKSGTGSPLSVNTTNWSGSAGFGSDAPAWFKDPDGYVHLQGAAKQVVSSGGDPSLVATLPAELKPCFDIYTIAHTYAGTYADLVLQTNGQIRLIAPRSPLVTDYSFVSLESITYFPCTSADLIALNTADWSGNAGYSSQTPAWFLDISSGVVHLQGAAKQVSTSGDPTLLGTLPPNAVPARTIYTVVHTYAGTYADLSIGTNGEIRLIAPRSPAATDFSFVSLEGINYLR